MDEGLRSKQGKEREGFLRGVLRVGVGWGACDVEKEAKYSWVAKKKKK